MTYVVFWGSFLLALLSIGLTFTEHLNYFPLLIVSFIVNVLMLVQNERSGFVHSKQAFRSGEPPRRFSPLQIIALYVLSLLQVFVAIPFFVALFL